MSDELDDEIGADEFGDEAFDDFEGGDSLGEMSRDNPLVKIGLVVGAFAAIVGGIMLFGGEKEQVRKSVHATRADVSDVPGQELSDVMEKAVKEKDVERVERAIEQRGSAMPTPTTTAKAEIRLEDQKVEDAEDPLERWRRIQEERQKKEQELPPAKEPKDDKANEATVALSEAMMAQMQAVLETKASKKDYMSHEIVTEPEEDKEGDEGGASDGKDGGDGSGKVEKTATILLPAGTIEYGQILIEASTDAPGPVLAQLASGPLAGSKLIGSFEAEDEYLVISFNTIVIDGVSYSIDAVALDPDTTLPGMATEVDKRYFSRYVLPAAAAFVAGVGSAIAETGSSTVSSSSTTITVEEEPDFEQEIFKGVEDLASKVEEIIEEETSDVEPLIRVSAGTAMGILFVEPVTDET